ncbi:MAG: amidohydrolase [Pseudomonadota bacterium]
MNTRTFIGLFLLGWVLSACERQVASPGDASPQSFEAGAKLVFLNADIRTMDNDFPRASALCVDGNKITYIGDDEGAKACVGDGTRIIEGAGRLVLPGLIDSHMHAFVGSISEQRVNLSLADTMEKLITALENIREDNPGDGPVYARGWQNHLFGPKGPPASLLDDLFGDRVVILGSVDGHSTWFSSKAFELGGATKDTPDPEPGVRYFERDEETGDLLGTAREGAGGFIVSKLISRNREAYRAALLRWLPRAAEAGLTGFFDAGMGAPSEEDAYALLAELQYTNDLKLRAFTSTSDRGKDDDPAGRFLKIKSDYGGEFIRPTAIKLFADGVPEAHTAFLSRDYIDRPGYAGKPMTPPSRMERLLASATKKDVPVHIHAIGGGAIDLSLNAIERTQTNKRLRHTIAHMDLVDVDDIGRFVELGVIPQTSIQWATKDPSFANIASFVGEDAMKAAYPTRQLVDTGAKQTFGTDWPASAYLSTFKPFIMIETAVTRRLPGNITMPPRNIDEALTVEEAVQAMTINSAYQLYVEDEFGSLEVGKKADLILLHQNIFEIPASRIHDTRALLTVVNGRVVHDALGD